VSLFEEGDRLLEIENVDAVAFGKNVWFHPRVPAVLLVAEVNAGFEQRLETDTRVSRLGCL
jgi:uncharacterized linocin/CFP29 family protein